MFIFRAVVLVLLVAMCCILPSSLVDATDYSTLPFDEFIDSDVSNRMFDAAKHRRQRRMRTTLATCTTSGCGDHGTCVTGVGCVCDQDTTKGFWAIGNDGKCVECANGYAGSNCMIECQGGSCNQCNQNGECFQGVQGDGTCQCYRNRESGFWSGSTCGQCASGYFGSKCQNFCPGVETGTPCANRGTCQTDSAGNGACVCLPGYGADSGCANCDESHYSVGCSITCPGYLTNGTLAGRACSGHGKCFNGTAGNGTCVCDKYWGLEDCSKKCPNECSNHGDCNDGADGTATCTCDKRYAPPDCQFCIANKTGPLCQVDCPVNPNKQVCFNQGDCTYTLNLTVVPDSNATTSGNISVNASYISMCNCAAGYTGTECQIACPGNPPCNGHGVCRVNTNTNATYCDCFNDTVRGFWTGELCSTCSVLYNNSLSCTVPCPVAGGLVCSGRGYCAEGFCYCQRRDSERGFDSCDTACDKYFPPATSDTGSCSGCGCFFCVNEYTFGQTCSSTCPGTANGVTCSGNGVCSEGKVYEGKCMCNFGYAGSDCSSVCPTSPLNAKRCSGFERGTCVCGSTSTSTNCVPRCACRDGYAGSTCQLLCPIVAGRTCSGHGVCDPVTALCSCEVEYTGYACNVPCGCNTEHGVCSGAACVAYPASSVCEQCNCTGNFTGVCNLCKSGTQGLSCSGPCVRGNTSTTSKECICEPNWSTASCTVPCPVGSNGRICSGNGTCSAGNRFLGLCACNASLYGPTCETFCTLNYCKQMFGMQNPQCNIATGKCECQRDASGYWDGATCSTCVYGYWGSTCTDECDCSGHGSCDAVACYCSNDPVNGYFTGSTCDTCQEGFIGASCNIQDVAITRLSRNLDGLSGSFLMQGNATMSNPSLHSPVATVAAVDEYNNANILYVGGRTVAQLDTSAQNLRYIRATSNQSMFSGTNCSATSLPDVAYSFLDTQYLYFLMQPMNDFDDGCNLPIRLVVVLRQTFAHVRTLFLNTTFNGTVDQSFNYTVRVIAATSQSDTGDSQIAVKPRLAFLVAQTAIDATTGFLAPYPFGWVVHVAVEELSNSQSRTIVSRRLDSNFVANDIAFSAYTLDSFSVVAIGGYHASASSTTWDVLALYVTPSATFVSAFDPSNPSIKAVAPCWIKLSGAGDSSSCSYCSRVEKLHWNNNDLVLAVSSSLSDTDTVLVWLMRVQDMSSGSTVYTTTTATGTTCAAHTLSFDNDDGFALISNVSSRPLASCSSANCPEAIFHVRVTQTGTPTSQATAMVFDAFANVTYVALRVNAGNSASVLAKCAVAQSGFAVYGLLTLGYVTNVLGRSKPEVLLSMVVARKARILYGAVSGVQSLSVVSILLYEIKSIAPDIADQRNNTLIVLIGSGFSKVIVAGQGATSTYDTNCAFGNTFTPATIISPTEVHCYAPTESETSSAQSCGQQTLEVSMYNQSFVTANNVAVQRAQSAKLASVSPVRGAIVSATPQVINITGTGFQNSTFSRCKFFSNSSSSREVLYSPVKLITPNLIQCTQPNATEASYDTALLDVSIDGQLYTIDGPIVYEIVGQPAGIQNEPRMLTVAAAEQTNISFTVFVVDERFHKLDSLDIDSRTFYLYVNTSYDSDCSKTTWRPERNCIPSFWLEDGAYPNATTTEPSSRYNPIPCHNATLNNVPSIHDPWSPDDDAAAEFPIGYPSNMSRLFYNSVKVFALNIPERQGKVTFSDLFFVAPRVGNVTLTVFIPNTGWQAQTTIIVVPGTPFALAINNIADFESYSENPPLQSPNCSTALKTKFFIISNTPISQIELVIVDRMANVVTVEVNQYLLTALYYYIQDYDFKKVHVQQSPPAPTQRDNKFIYNEITLLEIHGASHYVEFSAQDRTNGAVFNTTTPRIRSQSCASDEYKVPLESTCLQCPGDGSVCDGSELIVVEPGYWRANGSTTHIYQCLGGPTICLGSLGAFNESYCATGHTGPLCGSCIDGYGKSGVSCVKCQDISVSASLVSLVVFLVFVVLVVWTIVTLRNAETTDISVIMRTVVNHMQATGELGAFSAQYGPFLQSFMSGQGAASGGVSVNGVQAFDCLLRSSNQNYFAVFAGFMFLPVLALFIAVVVFGVVRALKMVPVITPELRREIDEDIKNFGTNARTAIIKQRYPMFMVVVTTNCVIMFTLYQTIITQCANALQCDTFVFSEVDGVQVKKSFLQVDLSIECEGGTSPLTTPALIFAALYGLGIPLTFTLGYLFVNDTVNMPQLTKLMFMFLTGGYKEQLFFWQNLIMIRKLVLVLMIVFLKDDQELLNYCAMWIMSIALILQVWLQPAEKDEHNLVESISLAVIVITLNLGLLYFWDMSSFAKDALTLTLILITVGVLAVFVYFLFFAALDELRWVFAMLGEVKGMVFNFLNPKEKKKKRLRLTNVMDLDDDDLPPLPPPLQPRYGAHRIPDNQEAEFDEYSSTEEGSDGDDYDSPRYERKSSFFSPAPEGNNRLPGGNPWSFKGVVDDERRFEPKPRWNPVLPVREEHAAPPALPRDYYDDL